MKLEGYYNYSDEVSLIWKGHTFLKYCDPDPTFINVRNNLREAVTTIWNGQKKLGKSLFNSTLFNFREYKIVNNTCHIYGHLVEYKDFLAQRLDSNINLNIMPVGVTGITIIRDRNEKYLIFGKRSSEVLQYPSQIELVPSGSIDGKYSNNDNSIDFVQNLKVELREEISIEDENVALIKPLGVIFDKSDKVFDIICLVELELNTEKFLFNNEYEQCYLVKNCDLNSFIAEKKHAIIPSSLATLKIYSEDLIENVL